MSEKLTNYIDVLAQKLGVAAEHVYGVLIRQMVAEGIAGTIIGVSLLIAFILLAYVTYGAFTKSEFDGYGYSAKPLNFYAKISDAIDDLDGIGLVLILFVAALLVIFGITGIYGGILRLVNPEFYAIKELLDAIAGARE